MILAHYHNMRAYYYEKASSFIVSGEKRYVNWVCVSVGDIAHQLQFCSWCFFPLNTQESWVALHMHLCAYIEQITNQSNFFYCSERDAVIITHARYALHHYNAKHPVCPVHFIKAVIQLVLINFIAINSCLSCMIRHINELCLQGEEFDVVKPLMGNNVRFKGQVWFHVNFWARCRKNKKIKRFFAEVHYKPSGSRSVCSDLTFPVPGAKKPQSTSSSSCSDLPLQVPEAEKPSSSSNRVYSGSGLPLPLPVPIVEACTIIGMYLCIWISVFLFVSCLVWFDWC